MTLANTAIFSNTTPAAPTGYVNVEWQQDAGSPVNISAYVPATANITSVALAPSSAGAFTVAHGLGTTPTAAVVQMTSGGQIWLQTPTHYDATNLYLVASDAGVTGSAVCFH